MSTVRNTLSRTVHTVDQSYPVRRHDEAYRYRVTIPRKILDAAGVENKDSLGVSLTHQHGCAVIVYSTRTDDAALQFSVSKHSTGELSIPSAIGASLNLAGSSVQWSHIVTTDGVDEFRARTAVTLPQVDTSAGQTLKTDPLKHVNQRIERDDDEWGQEYFRAYLNSEENTAALNWAHTDQVAVRLVRVNDVPSIQLTPQTAGTPEKARKDIIWTNKSYHTGREDTAGTDSERPDQDIAVYVPNSIVHALTLVDTPLVWVALDGTLTLVPTT